MKSISILFLLSLSITTYSHKKVLLLDLGGILFDYSSRAYIRQLGIGKLLGYIVLDRKFPTCLQDIIFKVLDTVPLERDPQLQSSYTSKGKEFPYILTMYQSGKISSCEALKKALDAFNKLKNEQFFVSDREAELVRRALLVIVTPVCYADTIVALSSGRSLLYDLAHNNYLIIAVSNWDKESFQLVKERFKNEFALFDDCIISGDCGFVKPNTQMLKIVLDRHNLSKEECIFIDDQPENIEAAQAFGIDSILYKSSYQIRSDLAQRGLISKPPRSALKTFGPFAFAIGTVALFGYALFS